MTKPDLRSQLALRRARQYIAHIPPAVSGQNGHNQTFSTAIALVHGFDLSPPDAWPLLVDYNARCVPPWSEPELRHKLTSATELARHTKEKGHLLITSRQPIQFARPRSRPAPKTSPALGQVHLRDLPELTSPAADSILDPRSTILSPPTPPSVAHPASISDAPMARGPTIRLPRSLQGFTDPRADPEREWLHIRGYMSVPPKNCFVCWISRSRSLWIGACYCSSATLS